MKNTQNLLSELAFFLLLLLLLVSSELFAQQKTFKPVVGFCLDDFNVDRWYQDRDLFSAKVKELGGEVALEVAYSETAAQIEQVRKLVAQGVKVIVIVPTDGAALSEVISEARGKGVKVIAYDRMITGTEVDYYVSYDSEKVGALMAQYMIEKKPRGNYAIISGPDSDANAAAYRKGQQRVLQPLIDKGDITLIYDEKVGEWTEMEAMIMLNGFLDKDSRQLDVVLAANDGLASGAIIALAEHNRTGQVLVSGQDADLPACKLIYRGEQAMTVYKPVQQLAYKAAELAIALATNKKMNKKELRYLPNGKKKIASLLFTPVSVDKQNLEATVLKDQHKTLADLE